MTGPTIIERELTPEHADEIKMENNNNLIKQWGPVEILRYIDFCEKEINLASTGSTSVPDLAWRYVLFPSNQPRDSQDYPINFDTAQIKQRKDVFVNACRELLARANQLELLDKPSTDIQGNETTISRRIKRIIKFRQNMYEQFCKWEENWTMINHPAQVGEMDSGFDVDDKVSPYQSLLLHLLNRAYCNGYRRYKEQCCIQIRNTRAWKPVKEIKDFVYDETQKEDQYEMWKNLTSKGSTVADVIKHLTNCRDHQFPEIQKNRHVWSFKNGILIGKNWSEEIRGFVIKFYEYDSPEFACLDSTIVSSKYFNLDFDPFVNVEDWYDIPTPHMQKILDYQNFPEDVCRWLYVFCGRLCFDTNDLDGWQVIPFLKGIARSGKSTIVTKVCKKFYESEDVKTLSNNIEKKFGLDSIHDGFMFISPEVKGDLQLEQAEFQSLVSGEDLSIARKFKTAKSLQWKTPGILAGNEVPNWKDNSGSVLRRLATWNFARQVMDADPHLDEKLDIEIPAILCKCVRAYLDYARQYSDKDIWNVLPAYFKTVQNQVAMVTNSLQHFLASEKVRFGPDLFCLQKTFIQYFNSHCQENNLGRFRFNPDFYAGPFSSKDITVRTDTLTYDGRMYTAQPFIFGVDIITDNKFVDNY
jgi:hypothetical protein